MSVERLKGRNRVSERVIEGDCLSTQNFKTIQRSTAVLARQTQPDSLVAEEKSLLASLLLYDFLHTYFVGVR